MVLILFPEEHIHPELSGRVLHSSPSRHGSISHHHFPITMDAGGGEQRDITQAVRFTWTQVTIEALVVVKQL